MSSQILHVARPHQFMPRWKPTASITHSRGYFPGQTLLCLLWVVFRASPEFCIFLQYLFHICPISTQYGAVLCCFGFCAPADPNVLWCAPCRG